MRLNKSILPIFLITFSLLFIIPQTPLAHAITPTLVTNVTFSCGSAPCTIAPNIPTNNEIIIVNQFGGGISCPANGNWGVNIPTDTFGDTFVQELCVGISTGTTQSVLVVFVTTKVTSSSGSNTITFPIASSNVVSGDVLSYTSFNNFGTTDTFNSGSASGTNTRTINVQQGAIIIGQAGVHVDGVSCGSQTPGSSQTVLASLVCQTQSLNGSTNSLVTSNVSTSTSYSDTITWANGGVFGRWLLEIDGPTGNSIGLITQCYGACGSTPITLTNGNVTHGINFNQSYTIFYYFQSNLNGFLLNTTTSLARGYSNGQQVGLGVWTASCPAGATPFTLQCAGTLQPGSLISNPNPSKGKFSVTMNIPIVVGQWVAIGVSGVFSGLDLNQTDKGCGVNGDSGICVPPMQFTRGIIPQSISSAQPCGAGSSPCNTANISTTGIWAWIQGNVVVGAPPPTLSSGCTNSDSACFLVASACGLTPSNCFIGGSIIMFIYFVVFVMAVSLCVSYVNREYSFQINIPPSLFFLFFLIELFSFAAIGLVPPAIVITIFIIVGLGVAGYFGSAFLGRSGRNE